ncbi:DUF397 domain-containing protein [Streptomyces sp. JNUCC 63]
MSRRALGPYRLAGAEAVAYAPIEIALRSGVVLVRGSKDTQKQSLTVSPEAWSAFTTLAADSRV